MRATKAAILRVTAAAALLSVTVEALAGEHVVVQKDKKFSTTALKVKSGDTVVFKNDEKDLTHNVYSLGPKNAFDIQVQEPGKSSSVTFKEKGTTEVECAIHPNMKLKVDVE